MIVTPSSTEAAQVNVTNGEILFSGSLDATSSVPGKNYSILKSQSAFENALVKYTSEVPNTLNFDEGAVILLDIGQRANGGFDVALSISQEAGNTILEVDVIVPGGQCITTQALSNPYKFVWIENGGELLIRESIKEKSC